MTDSPNQRSPIFDEISRKDAVIAILKQKLGERSIPVEIERWEIQLHDKYLNEITGNHAKISNLIYDHLFPKLATPIELWHYTTPQAFESIIGSAELRLFWLKKWIEKDCGEIETFAKKEGFDGYLDDSKGMAEFKKLSENLFYASFTPISTSATDEAYMWDVFGGHGQGARIKFEITLTQGDHRGDLRGIQYEQPGKTLLGEINEALANSNEPAFLAWSSSRVGAFYLPDDLGIENEIRLLVKHFDGASPDQRAFSGADRYWPVPIGRPNPVAKLEMTGIELGQKADHSKLRDVVTRSQSFKNVPCV
jgi:hypothetical protein